MSVVSGMIRSMSKSSSFAGISVDGWQAIGATATAGAFLVAALAVLVAFLQLKTARQAAEKQLAQDRSAAAAQLAQDRDTAAAQLAQNQHAAEEQLRQTREAATEQMEQDRLSLAQQLAHAADVARDQTRPYVLMSAELNETTFAAIDLVLQNAGQTAAHDVRITVDPPFVRAQEDDVHAVQAARIFARSVSMLPPGYRIASYLDSATDRHELGSHLPDEHRVTIEYNDGRGNDYTDVSVVDLTIWDGLWFGERYGVHDAAKALREVGKVLSKSKLLRGEALEVVVEDREKRVERLAERRTTSAARHQELLGRIQRTHGQPDGDINPADGDGQA